VRSKDVVTVFKKLGIGPCFGLGRNGSGQVRIGMDMTHNKTIPNRYLFFAIKDIFVLRSVTIGRPDLICPNHSKCVNFDTLKSGLHINASVPVNQPGKRRKKLIRLVCILL